jgi:hypothetical protein
MQSKEVDAEGRRRPRRGAHTGFRTSFEGAWQALLICSGDAEYARVSSCRLTLFGTNESSKQPQ